ncbi:hypothetical protein EXS57_02435 [Candidatus Kaiserbacteria bacterium]|nr:hypothetical protein [Candidatus Kaiserbacteria bacterium]
MKYLVWLEDTELQSVRVEAKDSVDARRKTEQMIDDGTLWNDGNVQFTESCFEVRAVETVH